MHFLLYLQWISGDGIIIRKEIIGISKNIQEIGDRRSAIKCAADSLRNHDILLIAGKGHEKYQIIKKRLKARKYKTNDF